MSEWSSGVCCSLRVASGAVLAAEIGYRAAEIADIALDFGAERNAPAANVIARRVADALRGAPDRLVDPIAPFALVLKRRVGSLQIARQGARARRDGVDQAAFMTGKPLLELESGVQWWSERGCR